MKQEVNVYYSKFINFQDIAMYCLLNAASNKKFKLAFAATQFCQCLCCLLLTVL